MSAADDLLCLLDVLHKAVSLLPEVSSTDPVVVTLGFDVAGL